ncbi:MAG: Ppx/GppA family phosphatase [Verrucomicrobia bacterium]|nr:Ppx/GppA family phosphatase [Verrucomicrobiota bacterium]
MQAKRLAVLDLGSNSVKLLVAQAAKGREPDVLLETSEGTRIGEGIHRAPRLTETAIQRTLDVIQEFKIQCRKWEVAEWRAVATSAVRDAVNRAEFVRRFQKAMGFPLRVLSGEEEAELIYRGATSDAGMIGEDARLLVMDSGGGSAEWICGTRRRIEHRVCLDLGCVRMTERFLRGDPYTEDSFRALLAHYEKRLEPLRQDYAAAGRQLIGTGGAICTAAALDLALDSFDVRQVHGHHISLETLAALLDKLRRMSNARRLGLHGLPRKRADIIVAGLALFVRAMQILGAKEVTVSLRGLRYGVLLDKAPPRPSGSQMISNKTTSTNRQ